MEGAAFELPDLPQALDYALHLVYDPAELEAASSAALAFALRHRGAALRTCARIVAWLARQRA